jgi:hypothetical protein
MANETSQSSGLNAFGDPSKLNFFNAPQQDQEEYQRALQASLSALEMRYAQPNWFKVAASLAKPQLGGFMASLGSGAEALGENIEQQRANLLPISQLRAQLAMSKIGMGQNKLVADKFQEWKDNGSKPEELMGLRDLAMATAPNAPVTAAIGKRYDSLVTERQLSSADQANVIGRINTAKALGRPVDPADIAKLAQYSKTTDYAPNRSEEKPEPFKPVTDTGVNADYSLAPKLDNANLQSAIDNANNIPNGENGVISTPVQKAIIESSPIKTPSSIKSAPKNQNELSTSDQNLINQLLGAPNTKSAVAGKNPQLQPDQDQKTSNEKYPILHPRPNTTDLDETRAAAEIAFAKDAANKTETIFEGQFKTVAPYMNPTIIDPYRQSVSKVLNYTTNPKTKDVAESVFNVLGQGTLTAQTLKSLQAGLQANISGGLLAGSFSLSFPTEIWKDAGLKPNQYEMANKITSEMAKQVFYEAALKGYNLNQLSATEFNSLAGVQPNRRLSLNAVISMEKSKDIDAFYQNKLAHQVVNELGTKVDRNEIAKLTSVYTHSPTIKKIRKAWDLEKKNLD